MDKKGFTLFQLLASIVVIIVVFLLAIPIVKNIIDFSRYKSFQTSALNVIDAVDYYIANNKFVSIPEEGMDIVDLDTSILRNNNFDNGVIVRRDNQTKLVYLKQGIYCAKGSKIDLKTTDKGCGALDESAPEKANLFIKNETKDNIYIIGAGYDSNSKIIKYELSIDGGKYYSNDNKNYNVFELKKDSIKHKYKVRVTNEANLSLESETKEFDNEPTTLLCIQNNILKNVSSSKNITCKLENEVIYDSTINKNEEIELLSTSLNIVNIDSIVNDNIPVLDQNMIPVIYNGKDWVVANRNTKYWDYENKIWANAIVVRKHQDVDDPLSKSREYYLSNEAIGEKINNNDVLAYYVWIPKYSYKLWNKTGTDINKNDKGITNIDIVFANTIDQNETNSNYINHQAFKSTTGFWVSKYEANISKDSTCSLIPNIQNCNIGTFDLYFVPDLPSLKNISISNAYNSINKINEKYNKYGISNNVHLLTNLEWGAITYLAHSKYGIGNNITTETTTGNETGIYNMGINQEFVMANYNNDIGYDEKNNSGFTNVPSDNTDIYNASTTKGRKLGDATLETENWYGSKGEFINGSYPFMVRGTDSIFSFTNSSGYADKDTTFRSTLIINN